MKMKTSFFEILAYSYYLMRPEALKATCPPLNL